VAQLRQEELELLVGKLPQFRAEHIVYSDMICISPANAQKSQCTVSTTLLSWKVATAPIQPGKAAEERGEKRGEVPTNERY
jgi:hypothetical protein